MARSVTCERIAASRIFISITYGKHIIVCDVLTRFAFALRDDVFDMGRIWGNPTHAVCTKVALLMAK